MSDKQHILVVDDDPDLVESITMKLESNNFRVTKAYLGDAGDACDPETQQPAELA